MRNLAAIAALAILSGAAYTLTRPPDLQFEKQTIDLGSSESCTFADINGDGRIDIVSGENWYEAPAWKKHRFRSVLYSNFYVDSFSALPLEVNEDGKVDIVDCGWFSKKLWWNENPGQLGVNRDVEWKEHLIEEGHNVEFAFLVDLENSGKKRDVLPEFGGKDDPLTWYEPRAGAFIKHVVSSMSYGHGIGAGDVNGDGRTDIITPKGWFEAPSDPRTGTWKFHPDFDLGVTGFIYALDINGDGRMDLITTAAHDYGFFWMEHRADDSWIKHMIDDGWAGGHAMTMADLNGDGKMDFLTGKRFMAHNGHDNGEREPLGVYWYEYLRGAQGNVEWVKHIVDYGGRTGGGMQIPVADINSDGALDFAVAGKSGLFLFNGIPPRPR